MITWEQVRVELINFNRLDSVNELTIDTLHGSMWGLNMRYMSLEEALKINKNNLIAYSLKRINKLVDQELFTFKVRSVPRCGVGYGTYGWKYNQSIIEYAIKEASVIDTAEGYGFGKVETELGKILKILHLSPIEVITKVRRDHMSPIAITNAVKRSVEKLNRPPNIQLHFPNDAYPDAVKYLADLRKDGYVKSIGLSNCSIDMIESAQLLLSEYSGDVISSVQMPFNLVDNRLQKIFIPYCQKRGIVVLAYSPLGQKFERLKSTMLTKMAKKYCCTQAQIALAWVLSFNGVLPIPNSNNLEHLRENFACNDLYLDKGDVIELTNFYTHYNGKRI